MIFCQANEVNAIWSVVVRATVNNELGTAAKVAPNEGNDRKPRLMCIYTKNFNDKSDVTRVVNKLKDLGVIDRVKPIYYKCGAYRLAMLSPHRAYLTVSDAYTYLGIDSSNEYNIKASLYKSIDIFDAKQGKGDNMKIDGFFYKAKKDEGN